MKQLVFRLLIAYLLVITASLVFYKISFGIRNDGYYGMFYGKKAPDFTLRDQDGNRVSLSQFRGSNVLLVFGYTSCPDVCPTTLSELNRVTRELDDTGKIVQVLFITIDPERDTPDHLKQYLGFFNKTFIGLTGEPEDIKKVADSYSVFYEKEKRETVGDFYFMSHTQTVFLIDRKGNLSLLYPFDKLDPEKVASDIKLQTDK
ncbi:MAG TPA: SCO family protein, partial [Thermodesulfobacteriota bacterium]|nr:SCO family protein [Thermodesulfobacteriota bacterium]